MTKNFKRRLASHDGVAMVEMALVMPLLLILVLGIMDFGKAFNYWNDSTHMASTGARFAAVNNDPGGSQSLQKYIQQSADTNELRNGNAGGSVTQPAKVCISFPNGTSNVGDPVEVTVTANYKWLNYLTNTLGLSGFNIQGSAIMRIEQPPTNYSAGCS
jgi:Flp pilus assembly protein TadG